MKLDLFAVPRDSLELLYCQAGTVKNNRHLVLLMQKTAGNENSSPNLCRTPPGRIALRTQGRGPHGKPETSNKNSTFWCPDKENGRRHPRATFGRLHQELFSISRIVVSPRTQNRQPGSRCSPLADSFPWFPCEYIPREGPGSPPSNRQNSI